MRQVWLAIKRALLALYGLTIRVKVIGRERVGVPLCRGFIVAANHLTGADSVVLQIALRTRLFFVAWSRWFKTHFVGYFMRNLCDTIPVNTGQAFENIPGIRRCFETLRQGGCVGIYPEGELNRSGQITHVHDGCAYLAVKTGTPILPVYIRNLKLGPEPFSQPWLNEAWEGFLSIVGNILNTRIEVIIGEPIQPDPTAASHPDRLRSEISRINGELLRQFDRLTTLPRPSRN
ncbi:MAG: lysophospholipid acyltransferase family protein [candidate division WOR-3 bacterium]